MINAALLIVAMTPGVDDTIFLGSFELVGTCPEGRQVRADIAYGSLVRDDVDVTDWDNIWGYDPETGGIVPFPGVASDPIILDFGKTTYIAAHFHVPIGLPPDTFGWIGHTEYDYGQDLTASISAACGDFSAMAQACFVEASSGQNLVAWAVPPPATFCPLVPGQDYFFNVKMTDPSRPSSTCPPDAAACAVGLPNHISAP